MGFLTSEPEVDGFFVKEAVLPWKKFTGIDALLGPEMRSTGEVMGHAASFGHAFAKSQLGAGPALPLKGGVLITVNDFDKGSALKIARDLRAGLHASTPPRHRRLLRGRGAAGHDAGKGQQRAAGYTTLDALRDGKMQLIINTPLGPNAREDGAKHPATGHAHGDSADHHPLGGAGRGQRHPRAAPEGAARAQLAGAFDERNLRNMRAFYLAFPIRNALRSEYL
jgi:hypothetical protein